MSRYVIDTNVFIRRVVPPIIESVDAFFEQITTADELFAPQMLLPEYTSVLREQVSLKQIRDEVARQALQDILEMPIRTIVALGQFPRSFDLATQFQHQKAYDMQFVAVAEAESATIVTGDGGMRHAAEAIGVPVRFLR
jgi:predicted nucleic acid-binding protein